MILLGIAVNFEPTRIGLIPLLLARQKPLLQLLAFLAGCQVSAVSFGLLVLFVFQRSPFGSSSSDGGRAQIAVGVIALVVAASMAVRARGSGQPAVRENAKPESGAKPQFGAEPQSGAEPGSGRAATVVGSIFRKGRSPWISAVIGLASGVPSVDFLAVLLVIGTSPTSAFGKVGALALFVTLGSLVVTAPLVGYLFAPSKTLELLGRFGTWTRSRTRMEYAAAVALAGCLFIGLGATHL